MRKRNRKYYDVVLKDVEISKLKKGHTVHRLMDGIGIAIKLGNNKIALKIAKLEKQIRELKKGTEIKTGKPKKVKRKYVFSGKYAKKKAEVWEV